jgi:hypothetical protein
MSLHALFEIDDCDEVVFWLSILRDDDYEEEITEREIESMGQRDAVDLEIHKPQASNAHEFMRITLQITKKYNVSSSK